MPQYGQPLDGSPPHQLDGLPSLVFRAGSLLCAIGLDEVVETMRPLETRPLAGTPSFVRGISVLRGIPTPVIDVARLLTGDSSETARYVAVRTERGTVALATGPILGIRTVQADAPGGHPALLAGASSRLITGVATIGEEPLLVLQNMRAVPDEVWYAAAAAGVAS